MMMFTIAATQALAVVLFAVAGDKALSSCRSEAVLPLFGSMPTLL